MDWIYGEGMLDGDKTQDRTCNNMASVNFSQYRMIYIPTAWYDQAYGQTRGGITNVGDRVHSKQGDAGWQKV